MKPPFPAQTSELPPSRHHRKLPFLAALLIMALPTAGFNDRTAFADSCADVVHQVNRQLNPTIDEGELTAMLQSLNGSNNTKLPPKFVTKSQAKKMGWRPGKNLWANTKLRGKSIGGDTFPITSAATSMPSGTSSPRTSRDRWRWSGKIANTRNGPWERTTTGSFPFSTI